MQLLIWSSLTYISYKQNFPKQAKYISIYQLDEKPFPHLYIENFQMIGQEYMLYHIMANATVEKRCHLILTQLDYDQIKLTQHQSISQAVMLSAQEPSK